MKLESAQFVGGVAMGLCAGYVLATFPFRKFFQKMSMKKGVSIAVETNRLLGEGPIWDSDTQRLLWVDKVRSKVFVFDPSTSENREVDLRQPVGTLVPRAGHPNQICAALARGVAIVDISAEAGRVVKWIGNPNEEQHKYGNFFNDGKCDPRGRLWAGTMDLYGKDGQGALYCVDIDGTITQKVTPANIPNGIVWSADATKMYWIDTTQLPLRIDVFDYDADTATITNRRKALDMSNKVWITNDLYRPT
jgi:sugar lactone lactonase YvrE